MGAFNYQTGESPVNVTLPIRGRYLSRWVRTDREAAFLGSDFWTGIYRLEEPSLEQSAFLAGSTVSNVWWATEREEYRKEILSYRMPLVPVRIKKPKVLVPVVYDDAEVLNYVRTVGVSRVLDAAVAVERSQH
jgi:hypothetical protein